MAAWLWSGRRATLAGLSAAAVLGSRWLSTDAPAELARCHRSSAPGINIHTGPIADDELVVVDGMSCTTVARTGYDLGRRLPFETAVRYPGARGVRRLRRALDFVDAGAESPQETRLRLLLVQSGLPRPVTQIPVTDQWGRVRRRIDMGYPQWMVAVEYDGEQHWTSRKQHAEDIERLEFLAALGWVIVRVSAEQLRWRPDEVVARVRRALRAAGCLV